MHTHTYWAAVCPPSLRPVPGGLSIHTFIHTYIHTHIHTHIHTYIHTHTHILGSCVSSLAASSPRRIQYTYIHAHMHTCTHTHFVQLCVLPRCVQSPEDSVYCAKLVKLLHSIKTPKLCTITFYNQVTVCIYTYVCMYIYIYIYIYISKTT